MRHAVTRGFASTGSRVGGGYGAWCDLDVNGLVTRGARMVREDVSAVSLSSVIVSL